MAYCTLSELKAYLPRVTISTSGTEPTETQAEAFIANVSAEIDAVLAGRGYDLPVSDADALAYLEAVTLSGSASLVLRAKHPTTPDIDAGYRQSYREALDDIRAGRVLVPDAPKLSSAVGEGFTTNSEGDAYEAAWTRETEW